MPHIIFNIRRIRLLFLFIFFAVTLTGCSDNKSEPDKPPRDNTPVVCSVETPNETVLGNDVVLLDCSNTACGYLGLTYTGTNDKVKFQIQTPKDVTYTYLVTGQDAPLIFPLTGGNGTYLFKLLESVDIEENLYAIVFQQETQVQIVDEFLPYLTPNIYTQFTESSDCVKKGMTLADGCLGDLDVIENIYNFVTDNITYDKKKAENISYGYIPIPDQTLTTETGICFDYASLMTAMLRSQRIPTKLEVGYAGDVYHAWISCYVEEIGWIDNIIQFDGEHWSLMDPTLAANNTSKEVQKYIGDGSNYLVKYTY